MLAHMGGERRANLTSKNVAQEQHCLLAEWGNRPVKHQEISRIQAKAFSGGSEIDPIKLIVYLQA